MFFAKSLVTLLAAASSALAITITGPSPSSFWVQNTSNIISWTFSSGDPNPIDITITNSNASFFNGPFSIARFVDLTNGSFTVTNVTLVVETGYVVNFVNSTDGSQVFASSQPFDVRAPGTPPASQSPTAPSSTAISPSNTTSTSGTTSPTSSTNAALGSVAPNFPTLPIALSAVMALVGGLIAL